MSCGTSYERQKGYIAKAPGSFLSETGFELSGLRPASQVHQRPKNVALRVPFLRLECFKKNSRLLNAGLKSP